METTLWSLKDGVDALLMSGLWRSAGLSFLHAERDKWTHVDLARWFMGAYHRATSFVPRSEAPAPEVPSVDTQRIAEIMRSACEEVVATLRDLASGGDPTFVKDAIRAHAVVLSLDKIFWIPLDHPRMRLADRALSLFAADYILSPNEYAGYLTVCRKCDAVTFDPAARQAGYCGAHRISGFFDSLRPRSRPAAGVA
jgi:hypothetical protein